MSSSPQNPAKPSLCMVAPKAYHALSGGAGDRHIGGAEAQQVMLARGLSRRGYAVSFVTLDHGQPDGEEFDGIRVLKSYALDAGLPGLRFVWPRLTSLWWAMRRANADVYYQRTSDSLTGIVAAFCRRNRRRFIYGVASDYDVIAELPNCPSLRERVLYKYGLCHAEKIVAQTASQQRLLATNFHRIAEVIPNAFVSRPGAASDKSASPARPTVLWIGRFAKVKRVEWLFELARRCRDIDFVVCGGDYRAKPGTSSARADEAPPNLQIDGYVPFDEMPAYYQSATLLLCTSHMEGFPNTFLEAWNFGVPVVTSFDPDGVVAEHDLGVHAEDIDGLEAGIRALCADVERRDLCGQHGRTYLAENHGLERCLDRYEALLGEVCAD